MRIPVVAVVALLVGLPGCLDRATKPDFRVEIPTNLDQVSVGLILQEILEAANVSADQVSLMEFEVQAAPDGVLRHASVELHVSPIGGEEFYLQAPFYLNTLNSDSSALEVGVRRLAAPPPALPGPGSSETPLGTETLSLLAAHSLREWTEQAAQEAGLQEAWGFELSMHSPCVATPSTTNGHFAYAISASTVQKREGRYEFSCGGTLTGFAFWVNLWDECEASCPNKVGTFFLALADST